MSVSPTNPNGIAGVSTITLTCTVILSGPGTPTISWSRPSLCGQFTHQGGQTSFTDTCELGRVRQSYAGVYACEALIGPSSMADTVTVSITGSLFNSTITLLKLHFIFVAPTVSVAITESQTPIALRSYTLMCVVTDPSTLALTTISYTWRRDEVVVQSGSQISFSSLPLYEDNVVYTCQCIASSVYLNDNVDVTSSQHTLRITSMWI